MDEMKQKVQLTVTVGCYCNYGEQGEGVKRDKN